MSRFGNFLLSLDVFWIILFISLCIGSFVVTTRAPFAGPVGENIRTDTFALRTHIMVSGTIMGLTRLRPNLWLLPLFIFLIFSDAANFTEICFFSPIRQSRGLWISGIIVVSYQLTITIIAFGWYIWLMQKKKTIQINMRHYL